ncbi:MAG TPA: histidinol-phosphate transaminase [Actinomycetes bacterium]|nr:histidinol-phosphate transaminase [Actinomycetes bacterium]
MAEQVRVRSAVDAIEEYRAGKSAPAGAFKLSSNENPYPPLPAVVAAIHDAASSVNRYPDFGAAPLIEGIAQHHDVGTDTVALGAGSVALLAQIIQVTVSGGDEVVLPWRSFEAYPILIQLSGATAVRVPLKTDHSHDLEAMANALTSRTRLVLLCSPNNPTGAVLPRTELEAFLSRVGVSTVVVLDEAYVDFVNPADRIDSLVLLRTHPNLILLRTFSKAYGLAGLRVGYAIAQPKLASTLRKAATPFGVTNLAQQAALASLSSQSDLVTRTNQLSVERDRVQTALEQSPVDSPRSHGNFVWLALGKDSEAFGEACSEAGVTVRIFGGEGVRVTIGEPEANDRFLGVAERFAATE